MSAASLQRIADALRREGDAASRTGRTETADALYRVRAVVLEELAEIEDRGVRARLRRLLGRDDLP